MANDANSAPKIVFGAMTFGKEGCMPQVLDRVGSDDLVV